MATEEIVTDPELDLARAVACLERSPSVVAAVRTSAKGRGVASRVPAGTPVTARVVADAIDGGRVRAAIGAQLSALGVTQQRRDAIDQCVDELVMNALFDAPVDEHGTRLFADVPPRKRVRLRTTRVVAVEWACTADLFAIAVRDTFGSLERATVLRHLRGGLAGQGPSTSRLGGAGLGLYLVASAANELAFRVVPGTSTEVVCVFGTQRTQLGELAFVVETAPDARTSPPARVRLAGRYRARRAAIATGGVGVVTVLVLLVVRLIRGPEPAHLAIATSPGATIELDGKRVATATTEAVSLDVPVGTTCRLTARGDGLVTRRALVQAHDGDNAVDLRLHRTTIVDIDSDPVGATVELDGHPAGTTPLHVTGLPAHASVDVAIGKPGYTPVSVRVEVPGEGETRRVVQKLAVDPSQVRVRIDSTPEGARLVRAGQAGDRDRTYTPAELYVPAGERQELELAMPHYAPAAVPPFTAAAQPVETTVELTPLP